MLLVVESSLRDNMRWIALSCKVFRLEMLDDEEDMMLMMWIKLE